MKTEAVVPNSNYKDKYVHLIGQDAAIDAAKKTESNKSYGFGKLNSFRKLIACGIIHFFHLQYQVRTNEIVAVLKTYRRNYVKRKK